jgi:hypothetical protein
MVGLDDAIGSDGEENQHGDKAIGRKECRVQAA